jgi:hypothetical protein
MSNYIVKTSDSRDNRATLAGSVAPRRFGQLTDVNMIGVQDKDIVTYDAASQTFVPITRPNYFPDEPYIIYVAKNGNDSNSGRSIQEAKLTIDAAVGIASASTVIRISAGNYTVNNPLTLPDQVSLVGHSLREVSVSCVNPGDMFYVGNGNYIAEMSFTGAANPGAIVSFDPVTVRYINQSPYIQNCTNFVPNSIGLKVDGKYAIGAIKSMVLDSYTQYNQGGIGVSITNSGYAQLVSLFTICDDIAVYCGSGGACDLTNSNSSFGNYGLVADGLGPLQYTGFTTSTSSINSDTFEIKFNNPTYNITNAVYDNVSGILTAYTSTPHKFSVGVGVSLVGLAFTCPSGPGIVTYPSGNKGYIFQTLTVAPGRYVDAHNLIQANKREIQDKSIASVAISYPDFYFDGDSPTNSRSRYYDAYRLIINNKNVIINAAWSDMVSVYPEVSATETKCKRDLGYFIDAVATDIFTGGNRYSREFVRQYFDSYGNPITNGLVGEEAPSIYAFNSARDLMKSAITNTLFGAAYVDLTLTPDPLTGSNVNSNSCANVRTNIDNLVGIITFVITEGNLTSIPESTDNYGVLNSGGSKCLRDIGYIIDAVSLDVRDYTSRNIIETTGFYFDESGTLLFNGLQGEVPQSIVAFNAARDLMKLAITNQLTNKDLSVTPDPITNSNISVNSCANVSSFIDNLVGILTTRIGAGNINGANSLPSVSAPSTQFSVYVGVSTLPHTYYSGGTAKLNISRPFDGQSIYFGRVYYSVNKIKILNGGSGYTSRPTITIDPPSTSWGIPAQAVASISNGTISEIEIVSSGRGYTTIPRISISGPNVGINTAVASIEIIKNYNSIQSSTDISSSGICTITINDNVPYSIGIGTEVYFYKQSRVLASGHSFEYIGSGTDITRALPAFGGVPIQDNETDARNGGLVVYTSTDQSGNFRIGDGVIINQQTGNISGTSYSKSLFSQMTPYILALGGES